MSQSCFFFGRFFSVASNRSKKPAVAHCVSESEVAAVLRVLAEKGTVPPLPLGCICQAPNECPEHIAPSCATSSVDILLITAVLDLLCARTEFRSCLKMPLLKSSPPKNSN